MCPKYYLALFNPMSWKEFLFYGGKVYGTTVGQRNQAKKIHKGDFLICYITGISEFVGILRIESESYFDNTRIWQNNSYPVRFDVTIVEKLSAYSGIYAKNLINKITILKGLKNPSKWGAFFLCSFNEIPEEDGKYLFDEIKKKADSRV
jgi:hypothetical protein